MEAGSDALSVALKLGEDPFRLAFDNAPIGMAIVGLDFRLHMVNRSLCDTLGYTESELVSRSFVELTHPDDIEKDITLAGQLFRGEIPSYRLEKRFHTKDGRLVWIDLTALVVRGKGGEALYGLALAEDITERKQAETSLRENEVRYRSFIANSSEGIWRFEAEEPIDTSLPIDVQIESFFKCGYLAECNDAMARMYGHRWAEEVIGLRLGDLLPASEPANVISARRFIENGYRLQDVVSIELDKDGQRMYFMNNVAGVVENGFLLRAWGTQQDITERKKAEDELRESRQQLRALAARIQALREEERAAISREIHDVLGQGLTSLKIDISRLNKKLPEVGDETVRVRMAERFKAVIELLDETLATVKNLCTELRPRLLDTFGLSAAVEWQCAEFQRRSGIACESRLPKDELPLSAEVSTALFRILQEALTNVARHSRATNVYIELAAEDEYVCLSVRDNGRGVTEEEIAASRSLGILGMRERAALFGGDVVVKGEPAQGTTVTARIPLDGSEEK
jgi:PAS domain S-box-containing protein